MGAAILMSPTIDVQQISYDPYTSIGGLLALYPGSGVTGYGTITSVNIFNALGSLAGNFQLYFFGERPTATIVDGGELDLSGDLDKVAGMGVLKVSNTSFITIEKINSYTGVTVPAQIGMYWEVKPNQDKPVIYMVMMSDGTESPGSLGTDVLKVGVLMEFGKTPI